MIFLRKSRENVVNLRQRPLGRIWTIRYVLRRLHKQSFVSVIDHKPLLGLTEISYHSNVYMFEFIRNLKTVAIIC